MKNLKLSALLNTPLGVVIVVGAAVLGVEVLIMQILNVAETKFALPDIAWNLLDAVTLTTTVSPLLYFLVFKKIQTEKERFRLLQSSAQDAIIVANDQAQIADWNLAAQKMFGYSREEAVGQPMHQLIAPPRYQADAARGFARFEETGTGPLIGKTTEIMAR